MAATGGGVAGAGAAEGAGAGAAGGGVGWAVQAARAMAVARALGQRACRVGVMPVSRGRGPHPLQPGAEAAWLWGTAAYWIQAFFALGLVVSAPLLWLAWGLTFAPEGRETEYGHQTAKDHA